MKKTRGVVGHPIGHSLSPAMHNAGYKALKLDDEFITFDILPENLADFVEKVRREKIDGLAITIPHKEKIMQFLDYIDPEAQAIGAVNTAYWQEDRLCGTNTDYSGFFEAIKGFKGSTLILGAGGASRACIYALKTNDCGEIYLHSRDKKSAQILADEFGVSVVDEPCYADLVVNATPVGMFPNVDNSILPAEYWQKGQIAYDLVMNPRQTKFIQDAEEVGCQTITGEKMLLNQGIKQFEIWTKQIAPKEAMQEALGKSLS